jgi:uncharacterized protein
VTARAISRLDALPGRTLPGGLRVAEARSVAARLRGLTRLDALPPARALLLPRCRSVHTLGMRFPLDLVWLAAGGEVVRVDRGVRPGRVRVCLPARSVLECAAGAADAFATAVSRPPGRDGSRLR